MVLIFIVLSVPSFLNLLGTFDILAPVSLFSGELVLFVKNELRFNFLREGFLIVAFCDSSND